MNIKINPKFRSLIPPLSVDELARLEANLLKDGCRDPLVVWNDTIIDGHNRHDICVRHELKYKTVKIEFTDDRAAIAWIIRNQFGRRNITLAARCKLAEKLAEALRPKAEASYKANVGRPSKSSPKLAAISKVDTREQASKEAGVSHGSMAAWKFLEENAEQEVINQLMTDPNAKLHRAVKDTKESLKRQQRAAQRQTAAATVQLNDRIIVGDFREKAAAVPDGSVSLIFTDPPYDRKSSAMLPDLGKFAAAKLADGGSMLLYVGTTQIPAALDALRPHLRYWWTVACIHAGRATVMREYGIKAGWKAVLWFVKTTRDNNSVMVDDTMSGGEEKQHHEWQQAQSEAEYWIAKLCPPDGLVIDPFLGGGTTGAAATKLKRQWLGFEIDPAVAKTASERIT